MENHDEIPLDVDDSCVRGVPKLSGKKKKRKRVVVMAELSNPEEKNTGGNLLDDIPVRHKKKKKLKNTEVTLRTHPEIIVNNSSKSHKKTRKEEKKKAGTDTMMDVVTPDKQITDSTSLEKVPERRKKTKKIKRKKEIHEEAILDVSTVETFPNVIVDIDSANDSANNSIRKKEKKKKNRIEKHKFTDIVTINDDSEHNKEEIDSGNEICIVRDESLEPMNPDSRNMKQVQPDWYSPLHYITGGGGGGCGTAYKLEKLKCKGIVPNKGKWTAKEVQKLHENMMDFLSCHKVKDFRRLIIPVTDEDKLFRKSTQFVLNMCRGIQRTRNVIFSRIITQYNNFCKKGAFSVKEKDELLNLQKIHGNKWKQIGILMNRSHLYLSIKHEDISRKLKKGSWSKEEDKVLTECVNSYLARGEKVCWTAVSTLLRTRSLRGCHNRWIYILSKRINETEEHIDFNEEDTTKLVSIIYESNIDDEYLIDWNDLASKFNNRVTASWLRWKFGVIRKEVTRSHLLEFEDVIDQLQVLYEKKGNISEELKCNTDGDEDVDFINCDTDEESVVDLLSDSEEYDCDDVTVID